MGQAKSKPNSMGGIIETINSLICDEMTPAPTNPMELFENVCMRSMLRQDGMLGYSNDEIDKMYNHERLQIKMPGPIERLQKRTNTSTAKKADAKELVALQVLMDKDRYVPEKIKMTPPMYV